MIQQNNRDTLYLKLLCIWYKSKYINEIQVNLSLNIFGRNPVTAKDNCIFLKK